MNLGDFGMKNSHSITDWSNFCREICLHKLNNSNPIGGPG